MKIVDRKTFLGLPAGVLYSKYESFVFDELEIKGESIGSDDFYTQRIAGAVKCDDSNEFINLLDGAQLNGTSFSLDLNCEDRDGMFDQDQLFAVWEADEIADLISRIKDLNFNPFYPVLPD